MYINQNFIIMASKAELLSKGLVNLKDINKNIILDIRYATENNFTNKKLYSDQLCCWVSFTNNYKML